MSTDKSSSRFFLGLVALCLGELRDGLTMINMQNAFLITSRFYTEKQAGVLFVTFGLSQFLFQTPAGHLMDKSDWKRGWLAFAAISTTILTLLTAMTAVEYGENMLWMILIKFVQGAVTTLIPPGLNSITQGIVGSEGMTRQVADNEMRNHFGTAIIILSGSLIAFFLYPDIGVLFVVSPIACAGVLFCLSRINSADIDHDAARGLEDSYALAEGDDPPTPSGADEASSPLQLLRDPTLLAFTVLVFLFHLANATVLPLVMQTLAIGEGSMGILMSGLCIIVSQAFMVGSAKVCGDYSGLWGRKSLFLIGLSSLPVRCLLLYLLTGMRDAREETGVALAVVILSTQILDGVGAGVFGTMYILVTSDIAAGTGRFALTLGATTAAWSIGGTVSGYLGQALAQDYGYRNAFGILGLMACVPAAGYQLFMPETLNLKKTESMGVIAQEREGSANEETEIV